MKNAGHLGPLVSDDSDLHRGTDKSLWRTRHRLRSLWPTWQGHQSSHRAGGFFTTLGLAPLSGAHMGVHGALEESTLRLPWLLRTEGRAFGCAACPDAKGRPGDRTSRVCLCQRSQVGSSWQAPAVSGAPGAVPSALRSGAME